MSTSYWMIEGIGIDLSKVRRHIDKEKVAKILLMEFKDDEDLLAAIANNSFDELDFEEYFYGGTFNGFGDFLTYCDDTDTITYGDDGYGGEYFYYPPSMPWEMRDDEPKSVEEVHSRIIAALNKVVDTSYLSVPKIEELINDELYVVGNG